MKKTSIAVFTLFPLIAFAAPENMPELDYSSEFFNMLMTLIFVIVLIVATTWFLKKFTRNRLKQLNGNTHIKILERRMLNQKASIYLVDVLGKGLVIAESAQGIHLLTEFSEEIDIENLMEKRQPPDKTGVSFTEIFNKLKNKVQKSHHNSLNSQQ